MQERFKYTNALAVPRMTKVTINVGTGKALQDEKLLDTIVDNITRISGQKTVFTKARKSIAAFKIRSGMTVGVQATLRGNRMYDFIEKLINITLPRVRDFQGINKKSVDANGNLSIGFKEHIAFPEIRSDEVEQIHGLEITITTTAKTHEEGVELFTMFGIPFIKD